ncbi:Uncharacterised protein [Achromobacter xylosoxidans]|uniref:hypothetical protein n=1 Tax=Achromobacter TaxID=222 RepID=UPI0006C5EC48|nr:MULTISPECIES: hypothetical protein [Achromobacter]CAB3920124.1 hypothetical protein LMG26846_05534 [Achromobacter insuavis]CUJ39605.1 Uncharacterised protein [Achromobacter sp. 2789STDY5608621]CUJ45083.1 Uncharacterised protein [Achromobacter xylosoxidans]
MTFDHLMRVVRSAAANNGPGPMSTGEALAAALVLNRADWLADLGYTIAQALDRLDEGDADLLSRAEKLWRAQCDAQAEVASIAARAHRVADLFGRVDAQGPEALHLDSELITYGDAPGYRDVYLEFDVSVIGRAMPDHKHRIKLRIRPSDGESIVSHIVGVHRFAWRPGKHPLDAKDGEKRPVWIERAP